MSTHESTDIRATIAMTKSFTPNPCLPPKLRGSLAIHQWERWSTRAATREVLLRRACFGGRKGASARRRLGFKPSTLRAFREAQHARHLLSALSTERVTASEQDTIRELIAMMKATGSWTVKSSGP